MITAKYGSKQFKVASNTLYTPKDVQINESIELEETEVKGKKPKTTVKGIKLQTLSFELKLDARFVTVETELRFWKNKLLGKTSDFFYLGNFKVGKFYVTDYSVKDFTLNSKGDYRAATLSLSFTEDGTYANSNKINFEATGTAKSNAVKKSAATKSKKTIKVGTTVKPKSGTRWYYTAVGALNRTGKSGKAYNKNLKVSYIYQNGKAINPQGLGWMRPEDVDIV